MLLGTVLGWLGNCAEMAMLPCVGQYGARVQRVGSQMGAVLTQKCVTRQIESLSLEGRRGWWIELEQL